QGHLAVIRRGAARRQPHPGRGPRQRDALLAGEHRRLVVPPLLGEQARLLRLQGCHRPDRRPRLPERDLPAHPGVGGAGVSEPRLLQRARPRQPLRGLAGAGHLRDRGAGGLQVPPQRDDVMSTAVETTTELRPFQIDVPEEALDDLRRRIAATQWPEQETDQSQGVPLATMQKLARHWATEYDWRKVESRLNAYPQFVTEI